MTVPVRDAGVYPRATDIETRAGRGRPFDEADEVDDATIRWGERVVAAMSAEFELLHASVFIHDPAAAALRLVAQRWGIGEDRGIVRAGEWLVPLHGSVCGWVYRSGSPALVGDVRRHPDFYTYPGSATRSELAVPIVLRGAPVGVLNLESPRTGGFAVEDVERLGRHAVQAAATLPPSVVERLAGVADGEPGTTVEGREPEPCGHGG